MHRTYWPTEDWLTTSPEDQQVDGKRLQAAEAFIEKNHRKLLSVILIKNGYIVWEKYRLGCDVNTLMDVRSITKSFTSSLIGIALTNKHISSIEQPLVDFIDYLIPKGSEDEKKQITLRQLLTMTSGFHWITGNKLGEKFIHRLHASQDWIRFIFKLPINDTLRNTFVYRSIDSHLLSVVLSYAVQQHAYPYAQNTLFNALGIHSAVWPSDPHGHTMGHVFLQIRSRDMAKLGYLYLHRGMWEQNQLIEPLWIDLSWAKHTHGMQAYGNYGFQWWIRPIGNEVCYYALGHGGQYIMVLPRLNAVFVMTQDPKVSRYRLAHELLEQFVIPSLGMQQV